MDTPPSAVFSAGLAEGRLRFQRCRPCRHAVFYPRVLCPACGADELDWEDSAGAGTVYSETTVHSREGSRQVVLVDLDEGFRVMGAGEGAAIGDRVRLRVDDERMVFGG